MLRGDVPPLPHFLLGTSHIPRLTFPNAKKFDLGQKDPTLLKNIPSASITHLDLGECETRSVPQLDRFTTPSPSLSNLNITWSLPVSGFLYSNIRSKRSKSSLDVLWIQPVPNISVLLDYFVKARPLVTRLKHLVLNWDYVENIGQHSLLLRGVRELLVHCGESR